MFGVDESGDTVGFLRVGDDMQSESRFATGLGAIQLDDPASRHALTSESEVERECAGADALDLVVRRVGQLHDRAGAEGLFDLPDGILEHARGVILAGFFSCFAFGHGGLHSFVPRRGRVGLTTSQTRHA